MDELIADLEKFIPIYNSSISDYSKRQDLIFLTNDVKNAYENVKPFYNLLASLPDQSLQKLELAFKISDAENTIHKNLAKFDDLLEFDIKTSDLSRHNLDMIKIYGLQISQNVKKIKFTEFNIRIPETQFEFFENLVRKSPEASSIFSQVLRDYPHNKTIQGLTVWLKHRNEITRIPKELRDGKLPAELCENFGQLYAYPGIKPYELSNLCEIELGQVVKNVSDLADISAVKGGIIVVMRNTSYYYDISKLFPEIPRKPGISEDIINRTRNILKTEETKEFAHLFLGGKKINILNQRKLYPVNIDKFIEQAKKIVLVLESSGEHWYKCSWSLENIIWMLAGIKPEFFDSDKILQHQKQVRNFDNLISRVPINNIRNSIHNSIMAWWVAQKSKSFDKSLEQLIGILDENYKFTMIEEFNKYAAEHRISKTITREAKISYTSDLQTRSRRFKREVESSINNELSRLKSLAETSPIEVEKSLSRIISNALVFTVSEKDNIFLKLREKEIIFS